MTNAPRIRRVVFMMTNTAPRSMPATKTEITGRSAKTASGRCNDGSFRKFAVGQRVAMTRWYDCGDGGDICFRHDGTIVEIAVGTEHGMHGTTALARIEWDATDRPVSKTSLVAVRHLCE